MKQIGWNWLGVAPWAMVADLPMTGTKFPALFTSAISSMPFWPDASPGSPPLAMPAAMTEMIACAEARGSPARAKALANSGLLRSFQVWGPSSIRSVFTPKAITP